MASGWEKKIYVWRDDPDSEKPEKVIPRTLFLYFILNFYYNIIVNATKRIF
jgi:hypothetical protein